MEYRIAYEPNPPQPFFPSSTFAFNTGGASITLDGKTYTAACMFCIASDPPMRVMEKGAGETLLVQMRTGGLFRLFGLNGVQYGGPVMEVEHGLFPRLDTVGAALDAAPQTLEGRVAALDNALILLAKTARPYGIGETFQFIADLTRGGIRVEDAAERLGVSVRTLERDCRCRFGRTPKRILRGWRVGHAIAAARSSASSKDGPIKWRATDPAANYSDQAHFLREHRAIGGLNPTQMHEAFRDVDIETICHSRGELTISCELGDPGLAAEYDDNRRYRALGPEVAKALGLMDW